MQTEIYSFEEIEKRAKTPWQPNTALISIGDVGMDVPQITYKPKYILRLEFDDIMPDESDEGVLFTKEMAQMAAEFIYDCKNVGVTTVVCQCEYGESRSAAVAAAIEEHFNGDGIRIFADMRYYPNKYVYSLIMTELANMKP